VAEIDTKDTKYFFSTLLTAVLSHHLAWVYTVSRTNDARHSRNSKSLAVLAESHPYNPLWAQLGDLFGAVTQPLKVTRTIVTGQSYTLVCRLLYLLTYFIRCSEIQPGVVDSMECPSRPPNTCSEPPSQRIPLSMAAQLEDSGDMSRASSAVTMCPSPHTPAPHDKEHPLVRTHPFSFRSPVPTTPEPRSHCSSGHEFQRSASGSMDVSDMHSTCRSGSSTDATVFSSLQGNRTPKKTPSDSLDSHHSHHSHSSHHSHHSHSSQHSHHSRNSHRKNSSSATAATEDDRQPLSATIESVPVKIRIPRDTMQAALNVPQPTTSATVPFLLSPERYNDDSESRSSASEYTMDRHLQAADEEIENSDPVDDVAPLPGATKQKPLWHYKRSTEMCASLASLESMGMCVVDSGHVRFDLARSYASPTNGASPPLPYR
jgi:hypothetical protein